MTCGEDEPVSVEPVLVRGVVTQEAGPQHVGNGRHAHGHAGMAGVGLLNGVHGKAADDVGAKLVERVKFAPECIARGCWQSDQLLILHVMYGQLLSQSRNYLSEKDRAIASMAAVHPDNKVFAAYSARASEILGDRAMPLLEELRRRIGELPRSDHP